MLTDMLAMGGSGGVGTIVARIYSAAYDTVTLSHNGGTATYVMNSSGYRDDCVIPTGSCTFTSTYAKNPSNTSQAYSKEITVSAGDTEIYVMPDNAVYWFGYKGPLFEECKPANGWSCSMSWFNPTYEQNDIKCPRNNQYYTGFGTSSKVTGTTAKVISTTAAEGTVLNAKTTKNYASNLVNTTVTTTLTLGQKDISSAGEVYVYAGQYSTGNTSIYALWIE